jgi:hypothetical protein
MSHWVTKRTFVTCGIKRNHCYRRGDGLSGRRYDLTSGILPSGKSHAEEKTERLKAPDQKFINRHDTDERSRGND